MPSFLVSPRMPSLATASLPAKSTMRIREYWIVPSLVNRFQLNLYIYMYTYKVSGAWNNTTHVTYTSFWNPNVMVIIAWDRLEESFALVFLTCLLKVAFSITFNASTWLVTFTSVIFPKTTFSTKIKICWLIIFIFRAYRHKRKITFVILYLNFSLNSWQQIK